MLKKTFYFVIILFLAFAPIYAFARIILPDWLREKISTNLPEGSTLKIDNLNSTYDLGLVAKKIIYEDVNQEIKIEIDNLNLKPKLDLESPIKFSFEKINFLDETRSLYASLINGFITFDDGYDLDNLILSGDIKNLSANNDFLLSGINFVLKLFNSDTKKINLSSELMNANIKLPSAFTEINGSKLNLSLIIADNSILDLNLKDFIIGLRGVQENVEEKIITGKIFNSRLSLKKEINWVLPIEVNATDLISNNFLIARDFNLKAKGIWPKSKDKCELTDLYKKSELCGKMTDVLNASFSLKNNDQLLYFIGDGYCVAPESGCPQKISGKISSRKTNEIFFNILNSKIVNPLISGILMASLISSPDSDNNQLDHSVNFEVNGQNIIVNGEVLF